MSTRYSTVDGEVRGRWISFVPVLKHCFSFWHESTAKDDRPLNRTPPSLAGGVDSYLRLIRSSSFRLASSNRSCSSLSSLASYSSSVSCLGAFSSSFLRPSSSDLASAFLSCFRRLDFFFFWVLRSRSELRERERLLWPLRLGISAFGSSHCKDISHFITTSGEKGAPWDASTFLLSSSSPQLTITIGCWGLSFSSTGTTARFLMTSSYPRMTRPNTTCLPTRAH